MKHVLKKLNFPLKISTLACATTLFSLTGCGGGGEDSAAPIVTPPVIRLQQFISFSMNNVVGLNINNTMQLSSKSTSGLPVSFASETPNICTITGIFVNAVAAGSCRISATQSGNSMYAPAISISRSFAVFNPTLLLPGAEPYPLVAEPNSAWLDANTFGGVYTSGANDGGMTLISPSKKITHSSGGDNANIRLAFGHLTGNNVSWSFDSTSFSTSNQNIPQPETSSGIFTSAGSYFVPSSKSLNPVVGNTFNYDVSNMLAVPQSGLIGSWKYTTKNGDVIDMNVDSKGVLSGSMSGCTVSGTILSSSPGLSKNIFDVSLSFSGSTCTYYKTSKPYSGLATLMLYRAGSVGSNGANRYLTLMFATSNVDDFGVVQGKKQ